MKGAGTKEVGVFFPSRNWRTEEPGQQEGSRDGAGADTACKELEELIARILKQVLFLIKPLLFSSFPP